MIFSLSLSLPSFHTLLLLSFISLSLSLRPYISVPIYFSPHPTFTPRGKRDRQVSDPGSRIAASTLHTQAKMVECRTKSSVQTLEHGPVVTSLNICFVLSLFTRLVW